MTSAPNVGLGSGDQLRERCGLLLWLARSLLGLAWLGGVATAEAAWSTFAENARHTALSSVAAQPLVGIRWATPVDEAPPSGDILIHYGSPLVTPANTVIIPVKTGSAGGYRVDARRGPDGSLVWSQATDYILPPHNWIPSYSPTLTSNNRLYFPSAGGTVYFRDDADSAVPPSSGQLAFFGMANYGANPGSFNATVLRRSPRTVPGTSTSGFAPAAPRRWVCRAGLPASMPTATAPGFQRWTRPEAMPTSRACRSRLPRL